MTRQRTATPTADGMIPWPEDLIEVYAHAAKRKIADKAIKRVLPGRFGPMAHGDPVRSDRSDWAMGIV